MNTRTTFVLLAVLISQYCYAGKVESNGFSSPTTLSESDLYKAQRQGRFFVVTLKSPHQVLSTSGHNGGQSTKVHYLVNHQSMEAKGDNKHFLAQTTVTREQYHQNIAKRLGLPAEGMALMGTAANMHQMAKVEKSFNGLTVTAFVTAGVKGNAQRAGDETRWYQTISHGRVTNKSVKSLLAEHDEKYTDNKGTINIVLLINREISAGAQSKVAILATEAKSAALAELAIASRVSSHLATGTGTDQIIIASPINTEMLALPSASGHLKLGELVGSSVREAVLRALRWQNKLERSNTSNVLHVLQRFGLTRTSLLKGLENRLSDENYQLAEKNFAALVNDARLTAAAFAYAQLLDRFRYQVLPESIAAEVLRDQAAQVAVSLSAKPKMWPQFWQQLSLVDNSQPLAEIVLNKEMQLFIKALALGWQNKWSE